MTRAPAEPDASDKRGPAKKSGKSQSKQTVTSGIRRVDLSASDACGAGSSRTSVTELPDGIAASGSDASSDESADDNSQQANGASESRVRLAWIRPTGAARDYPDWATWSSRHWAWEFLRRNDKFQEACRDGDGSRDIAPDFHLKRFKDFADEYKGERKAAFRVGIRSYPGRDAFIERIKSDDRGQMTFTTSLSTTEVLVKFQLAPTQLAKKTSLNRQVNQACRRLKSFIEEIRKVRTVDRRATAGTSVQKTDRTVLFNALRALDVAKLSDDHISVGEAITKRRTVSRKELSDTGRRYLKKGQELRDGGYLLVAFTKVAEPKP